MKKENVLLGIGIAAFIAVILNVFLINNSYIKLLASNIVYAVSSITLITIIVLCYREIDNKFGDEKRTWLFFVLAIALRFAGEIIYAFHAIIVKTGVSSLSIVGLLWMFSYLSAILGLSYKINQTYFENKKIIISIVMFLCTAVAGVYLYGKMANGLMQAGLTSELINSLYVALDVYIVGLLVLLIVPLAYGYNKTMKSYILVALAFVSLSVFDYLYSLTMNGKTYISGSPMGLFYHAGNILLIYAAYVKYKSMKETYSDDIENSGQNVTRLSEFSNGQFLKTRSPINRIIHTKIIKKARRNK